MTKEAATMKPILLATDGSPIAAEAAAKAIELALALNAPLVVATVWQVVYEPIGIGFGPVIPDLDQVGHDKALEVVGQAAQQTHAAGIETKAVVRRGVPAHEICALAEAEDAQLIVLGSHGWGAMRRMVFGSVSTNVLHHARRPVLVVPPASADEASAREGLVEKAEV
jgi:nucleotide-binding universal stress UspA family protein